jgi:hypothetical protein
MTEEKELLTKFNFYSIPMVEMLQEESQSVCNSSFLKILKIDPANKVHSFFSRRYPFGAPKTSLSIFITSLIGME